MLFFVCVQVTRLVCGGGCLLLVACAAASALAGLISQQERQQRLIKTTAVAQLAAGKPRLARLIRTRASRAAVAMAIECLKYRCSRRSIRVNQPPFTGAPSIVLTARIRHSRSVNKRWKGGKQHVPPESERQRERERAIESWHSSGRRLTIEDVRPLDGRICQRVPESGGAKSARGLFGRVSRKDRSDLSSFIRPASVDE